MLYNNLPHARRTRASQAYLSPSSLAEFICQLRYRYTKGTYLLPQYTNMTVSPSSSDLRPSSVHNRVFHSMILNTRYHLIYLLNYVLITLCNSGRFPIQQQTITTIKCSYSHLFRQYKKYIRP